MSAPGGLRSARLWAAALGAALIAGGIGTPALGARHPVSPARPDKARAAAAYGRLPLAFAPNVGQAPPGTDVVARGGGYSLALGPGGPTLALATKDGSQAAVGMRLVGASPAAAATTEQPLGGRVNYLLGNDPSRWHTGLPTYGAVAYRGVYPGIDARYHGSQGVLEYNFTLAPGARPGGDRHGRVLHLPRQRPGSRPGHRHRGGQLRERLRHHRYRARDALAYNAVWLRDLAVSQSARLRDP